MRWIYVPVVALTVLGCTPRETPEVGSGSLDFVGEAQTTAENLCRFVPTAETVTAIVAALFPAAVPAQAGVEVGRRICEEIARTSADRSLGPPVVAGIRVEGTFAV